MNGETEDEYLGRGRPWADFLHHRARAIDWLYAGEGDPACKANEVRIAQTLSMSATQVFLIRTRNRSVPETSEPLTLGKLIIETARSNQKERLLTKEEAVELRTHIAKALEPIRAKYRHVLYEGLGNTPAPAAAQCADWNRSHLVGTEVILTKDLGEEIVTQTRSAAFVSNSGHPVIFLNGIRGYYLLERVRATGGE